MVRPLVFARWRANVCAVWPSLTVGINGYGFLCVELAWLGLVAGITSVFVEDEDS